MTNAKQLAARNNQDLSDETLGGAAQTTGTTMQRVQTSYVTAVSVQKPRDHRTLTRRAVEEASVMGEEYFYSWPVTEKDPHTGERRKKMVTGESIQGALMLMRHWGNCCYEVHLVEETATKWTLSTPFIDLECGTTQPRLYQIAKVPAPGKFDETRWEDMTFQNGQSKAVRNCIVAAMPGWLKKHCMAAARKAAEKAVGRGDKLKQDQKDIVTRAKKLRLTGADLKRRMGGKNIEDYDAQDVVTMRSLLSSIERGEVEAAEIFGSEEPDPSPPRDRSEQGKATAASDPPKSHPSSSGDSDEQKFARRVALDIKHARTRAELDELDEAINQAHSDRLIDDGVREELLELLNNKAGS